MATQEERKRIFTELPWTDKISHLVKFYEAMIKKTDKEEYITKFQNTIDKLQSYEDTETNNERVVGLYQKILKAEQKTQERKKKESSDQLNKGQQIIQQIKIKEEKEESQEDADDFLNNQLADIGI